MNELMLYFIGLFPVMGADIRLVMAALHHWRKGSTSGWSKGADSSLPL